MKDLENYFQNSLVKVTKESYFEMCEMLGQEPIEADIPVEFSDLPNECQTAIHIYSNLKDDRDPMQGTYYGKSLLGLLDLFTIYEVELQDRKLTLEFIQALDDFRKTNDRLTAKSKPQQSPQ